MNDRAAPPRPPFINIPPPEPLDPDPAQRLKPGSPVEIFGAFLKLGLTSFGGPIAHLGYFRAEFVARRKWLDEASFANIVALSQFLPGPASSQVGFALGLMRGGGLFGGLAAWLAFTLPSALLLFAFTTGARAFDGPIAHGLLHGLNLVAVAVVAQAIYGMAETLTPDRTRAGIALAAVALVTFFPGSAAQIAAIGIGALAGCLLCRPEKDDDAKAATSDFPVGRNGATAALILFAALMLLPLIAGGSHAIAVFSAFYRTGALVFGGGHVVLPLLQAAVVAPGWVSDADFLAGYGLAQAAPGPLFTFAAYLGAILPAPPNGIAGSAIALVAIFLPGLLLIYGILPFWNAIRTMPLAQAAMRGANAAVVGILGAALYNPVWTSAVSNPRDFAAALAGFLLLMVWKAPPWVVVVTLAAAGAVGAIL